MREVLPNTSRAARGRAGDLIIAPLGTGGKRFSESPRTAPEIKAYAVAKSDMFLAYIEPIEQA
ncbi:hypothetical protein [Lysobacter antibioticus]|uniref:hypothetical protein n=1 Tax=Lysobacter antibioticus TaxID=84531 RepID=UPI001269DFA7|nr:hypothetical protein [Lysobacter antibioticus]